MWFSLKFLSDSLCTCRSKKVKDIVAENAGMRRMARNEDLGANAGTLVTSEDKGISTSSRCNLHQGARVASGTCNSNAHVRCLAIIPCTTDA